MTLYNIFVNKNLWKLLQVTIMQISLDIFLSTKFDSEYDTFWERFRFAFTSTFSF